MEAVYIVHQIKTPGAMMPRVVSGYQARQEISMILPLEILLILMGQFIVLERGQLKVKEHHLVMVVMIKEEKELLDKEGRILILMVVGIMKAGLEDMVITDLAENIRDLQVQLTDKEILGPAVLMEFGRHRVGKVI